MKTEDYLGRVHLAVQDALSGRSWLQRADVSGHGTSLYPLLPVLACRATGGDLDHGIQFAAVWSMYLAAAELLDLVQDGELIWRRPHQSEAEAIAQATGLLFSGHRLLLGMLRLGLAQETVLALVEALAASGLEACDGQVADASMVEQVPSADVALDLAGGKSGPVFAVGAWGGGRLGTADPVVLNALHTFGYQVGIIAQLVNDWYGIWCRGPSPDLLAGKVTLPVIYALEVAPESRSVLEGLLAEARDGATHDSIRHLLRKAGAWEFMATAAMIHRLRAEESLSALPREGRAALSDLLGRLTESLVPE